MEKKSESSGLGDDQILGPEYGYERSHFDFSHTEFGRLPGKNRFGEESIKPAGRTSSEKDEKRTSWSQDPRSESFGEVKNHRGKAPKNFNISDQRLFEKICDALTDHPDIDATSVDVKVLSGVVTLTGEVENRHSKKLAEAISESITGVKDVFNYLSYYSHVEGWIPGLSPEEKRKYISSLNH
jgi:hypothetical protein